MPAPDVALISPFPALGETHSGSGGVVSYSANLAGALTDAGARVSVIASVADGRPAVERDGLLEVRRVWRRGATALPVAAAAAAGSAAAPRRQTRRTSSRPSRSTAGRPSATGAITVTRAPASASAPARFAL